MAILNRYYTPIVYIDLETSTRWTIAYADLETSTRWTIAYADLSDPPNRFDKDFEKFLLDECLVYDQTTLKWESFRSFVDSFDNYDQTTLKLESFRSFVDSFDNYDQTTLKLESFRSFVDSFDNIDTVEKNNSVKISNFVYQDYVDNSYFVETQNSELTYVNTIGTNHTYTLMDNIEVYLNGVLQ